MATNLISSNENDIYSVLYGFIKSVVDDTVEVIRGIENRVSAPIGDFIVMTIVHMERLATNVSEWNGVIETDTATRNIQQHIKLSIQLDCYGNNSFTNAVVLSTLLRDTYGVESLSPTIVPLYTDDPIQNPLVNSESQYESRWTTISYFQFSPIITITQNSFTKVNYVTNPYYG